VNPGRRLIFPLLNEGYGASLSGENVPGPPGIPGSHDDTSGLAAASAEHDSEFACIEELWYVVKIVRREISVV
jgi:hypothetical protein